MKNKHASELGKRSKGVPKNLTPEERNRRKLSLQVARESRWSRTTSSDSGEKLKNLIPAAGSGVVQETKEDMVE